jgi:uncharacterized membrane protein HdeD (DUF308 family)
MDQALTRGSRLLAIGGVASVLFGVGALVWPGITLAVLVALFGAFVLVVGGLTLVYALEMASQHVGHWVPMAVSGVFGIAIGAFTFFRPGITALALLYTIAAWAILTGVLEIAAGVGFTGQVKGAWALWLGGLASVAFGFIIALQPASGLLTIVWLIGIYAIALGVTRMFYAYQIQKGKEAVKTAIKTFQEPVPAGTR